MFAPLSSHRVQKLQEVAFPRKDQLKRLLHEKYNKEHSEYLKNQVHVLQRVLLYSLFCFQTLDNSANVILILCIYGQSQAMAAETCGDRLQKMSLLEEERQRVAHLRKMQIESEQFRYFEDQLRRQEMASRREETVPKVPEQTDGSCLSQTPKNHVRLDPNRNKPALPIPKPAATLAAVQSEHPHII